jgi:protein-L-isoaspartate O-methyltransferase
MDAVDAVDEVTFLLERVGVAPGDQVLDVGCARGHRAALLAAAGAHVTGLEADAAQLSEARQRCRALDVRLADATDAAWARDGAAYDVVASLTHDGAARDALTPLLAAVRPGGRLVVRGRASDDPVATVALLERHAAGAVELYGDLSGSPFEAAPGCAPIYVVHKAP